MINFSSESEKEEKSEKTKNTFTEYKFLKTDSFALDREVETLQEEGYEYSPSDGQQGLLAFKRIVEDND